MTIFRPKFLAMAVVVAIVVVLVVAPTAMLVFGSFVSGSLLDMDLFQLLKGGDFTLKNFQRLVVNYDLPRLFFNSLYVSIGSTVFSLIVGAFLAWIITRTDKIGRAHV